MPTFHGFNAVQEPIVRRAYTRARSALQLCVTSTTQGRGTDRVFDTMFARFMGSIAPAADTTRAVKQARDILIKTITSMNARIASTTFTVTFDPHSTDNAAMLSFQHTAGDIQTLNDEYSFCRRGAGGALPMTIGPPFFGEPDFSLTDQSQVQTFLHELSHHAAGTVDLGYGMAGVQACVVQGPLVAVRNAENVGFFCVQWAHAAAPGAVRANDPRGIA